MMRTSAILAGLFTGLVVASSPGPSHAEPAAAIAAAQARAPQDLSAQSRRRPRRVPVYRGSAYPGPNAVRVCNAYYEQEYRPSGTVIVPRMRCAWRG